MKTYDLLVIGSGPAGQRVAISGVKKGKRVALAEARSVVVVSARTLALFQVKLCAKRSSISPDTSIARFMGLNYHVKEKVTISRARA